MYVCMYVRVHVCMYACTVYISVHEYMCVTIV